MCLQQRNVERATRYFALATCKGTCFLSISQTILHFSSKLYRQLYGRRCKPATPCCLYCSNHTFIRLLDRPNRLASSLTPAPCLCILITCNFSSSECTISDTFVLCLTFGVHFKIRNPPKVLSHSCANDKPFTQKLQINLIFCIKFLYIPNICCTFAPLFRVYTRTQEVFVRI